MNDKKVSATLSRWRCNILNIALLMCILEIISSFSCKSDKEEPPVLQVQQPEPVYDAAVCSEDYPNRGFYPKDPRQLQDIVDKYLKEAGSQPVIGEPIAVISPHAGYMFSGPVAAHSYKALEGLEPETVILVGPSHIYHGSAGAPLQGAAVLTNGVFKNPLGTLAIDSEIAKKIVAADPKLFRDEPVAFKSVVGSEHCLEVQLPFLQRVLKNEFKIVMILVNDEDVSLTDYLAKAIAGACAGRNVILVASSDLTHYPEYDVANEIDRETIESFLTLDLENILKRSKELLRKDVPGLRCTTCGLAAVMTVISTATKLGADSIKLLKYANSGDVFHAGRDSVVGYAALVLYRAAEEGSISQKGQKTLLSIARESIIAALEGRTFEPKVGEGELTASRGVFVTLFVNGKPRGCCGWLDPPSAEPLPKTVAQAALSSAFRDERFQPVTRQEIPRIKIRISILSPLMPVDSVDKIVLGKHGICVADMQGKSATFLPEVATDQGWNMETLLTECCKKARMEPDAWKKPDTKILVYTTQVFEEK